MSIFNCAVVLAFSCVPAAFAIAIQKPSHLDDVNRGVAMDELWSGGDSVSSSDLSGLLPKPLATSMLMKKAPEAPAVEKLHLFGMYDSGTNLLMALLQANIDNQTFKKLCSGSGGDGSCWFGKHIVPRVWAETALPQIRDNSGGGALVAAMVRSPLAQIGGWIKAPYGMAECIENTDWYHYKRGNCSIVSPPPPAKVTHISQRFSHPTDVWSQYVRTYHLVKDMADAGELPNVKVMLIEYERLVLQPEAVVRELISALGLTLDGPFKNIVDAAKKHGHSNSQEEAADKITRFTHLKVKPMSSWTVRANLCKHIDQDLLLAHEVPSTPPRTYATECERYPAFLNPPSMREHRRSSNASAKARKGEYSMKKGRVHRGRRTHKKASRDKTRLKHSKGNV